MALLNKNGEGGVISSETFNLTRITTVLGGGVAVITASGFDWTGFNPGQRLVLVVAAVAAIALISCADIMARALATEKAENAPVTILAAPYAAQLNTANGQIPGHVMAMRAGVVPRVLFSANGNRTASWQPLDQVHV
jgi:hypothetical protein